MRGDKGRYRNAAVQSARAAGGALDHCDFFCWFLAQRSAAITDDFVDAVEHRNHFVGPALVRMQLSGLLGLYAAQYHEKGSHEFVEEWMNGKPIGGMLDNSNGGGRRMTEGNLIKRFDAELPNGVGSISGLYGASSGWVHLDPKFFYSLIEHVGEGGEFQLRLYGDQFAIPPMQIDDELRWAVSMTSINNLMIGKLLSWAACKQEMFGSTVSEDQQMVAVEIAPQEMVAEVDGYEAVVLPLDVQGEGTRFSLWVNDTATKPKRNLAYVVLPTMERAEEFASWYIGTLKNVGSE